MIAFRALAVAMFKGTIRDKLTVFFTIFFPLFFIVIFGLIFQDPGASKQNLIPVNSVPFIDQLPADARAAFDSVFVVLPAQDLDSAIESVTQGDAAAAIEQHGNDLIVHISRADQVGSATVQGVLSAFVSQANIIVSGVPPTYSVEYQQVEDQSLKGIQFVAPGMIAYGVTVGATFGAAMTLITWRKTRMLRRLRLAPVSTSTVVNSRVVVSLVIALFQLVLLLGVSMLPFLGLQLNGAWYMSVPLVMAGTLAFLAIGLFVGAVSKTVEGGSGLANLIILPMGFLSGAFIPLAAAPAWLIAVSKILPMGWLVSGLSSVLVKGEGPEAALLPIGALLAFAVAMTLIATRFFQWDDA